MSENRLHSQDNGSQPETASAPSQGAVNFSYAYSVQQRKEVERIRAKYIPPQENKLEQLRRLDRQAERRGVGIAIGVCTICMLLLGIGMTLTMVYTRFFGLGVVVGVIGIAGMAAAYPLYQRITKKSREKIAPEILRLSEELIKGQK